MNNSSSEPRLDALLALALKATTGVDPEADFVLNDRFSALPGPDREALERRRRWSQTLTLPERVAWERRVTGRDGASSGEGASFLSASIHSSHLTKALRREPPRVARLVLSQLPAQLADAVAGALGLARDEPCALPEARVIRLVYEAFCTQFVFAAQLDNPTDLDLLSGVELARLIRLSGVRETALACRSVTTIESLAAFLRRFAAEDARALAAHLTALGPPERARVRRAEEKLRRILAEVPEPGSLLDEVGISLLSLAMTRRAPLAVRFTAQKLPLAGARALQRMIAAQCRVETDGEILGEMIAEIEALASRTRRFVSARERAAGAEIEADEDEPDHQTRVA